MKNIQEVAKNFNNVEEVRKAVRAVQSRKSRLKKQKGREDYDEKMTEILKEEQILKEVREYFEPKQIPVTQFTEKEVEKLNYEETLKAIKSIQSKKCNVQFATENIEDNEEYQKACEIEEMLKEHKEKIQPINEYVVRKSEIQDLINHFENLEEEISKEYVVKQLEQLIENR